MRRLWLIAQIGFFVAASWVLFPLQRSLLWKRIPDCDPECRICGRCLIAQPWWCIGRYL